jgi:6-phosphogluconolactonase
MSKEIVYVGSSKQGKIYIYDLNAADGALTPAGDPADASPTPSFLAVSPDRRFLYAINETDEFDGEKTGAVMSFAIDPATGGLTFINRVVSQGRGPAYVSVDKTGRFAFVAHYNGGCITVLPIAGDGSLGEAVDTRFHGADARAHSIVPDPDNRFVFVPNLGLDNVSQYVFDARSGKLCENDVPAAQLARGAGPRHMDFHPSGRLAYVINEYNDSVTAFSYDADNGRLELIHSVPTLPKGVSGEGNYCADVHVAPAGDFLYGSNREHDSIAVFSIDQSTGRLTPAGNEPTGGKWPRNFHVHPGGKLLLAANENSDNIVAFHIDGQTGGLTPTGAVTQVSSPGYVGVVQLPG